MAAIDYIRVFLYNQAANQWDPWDDDLAHSNINFVPGSNVAVSADGRFLAAKQCVAGRFAGALSNPGFCDGLPYVQPFELK